MAGRLDHWIASLLHRRARRVAQRGPPRIVEGTVHGVSHKADLIIGEKTRNEPVGLKDGGSKSVRSRDVVFTT